MSPRLEGLHKPCYLIGMKITSASQAIDALGGTGKVAQMFGLSYQVVTNWKVRGLPPDTHYELAPLLRKKGHSFSPLLFAQKMRAVPALTYRRGKPQGVRTPGP